MIISHEIDPTADFHIDSPLEEIVEAYAKHGYVIVRGAFDRTQLIEAAEATLNDAVAAYAAKTGKPLPERPDDSKFWDAEFPIIRRDKGFRLVEWAPRLHELFSKLVGGLAPSQSPMIGSRWVLNCQNITQAEIDAFEGDRLGWHLDVPQRGSGLTHLTRLDQPVLALMYWTDVPPENGGTLFAPFALNSVIDAIVESPDGIDTYAGDWGPDLMEREPTEVFEFSGSAGDVAILNGLTLHTAQPRFKPNAIRLLENVLIEVEEPIAIDGENPCVTAAQIAERASDPDALALHLSAGRYPRNTHAIAEPVTLMPRVVIPEVVLGPIRRLLRDFEVLLERRGLRIRVLRSEQAIFSIAVSEGGGRGNWKVRPVAQGAPSPKQEKAAAAVKKVLDYLDHQNREAMDVVREVIRSWHRRRSVLQYELPMNTIIDGKVAQFLGDTQDDLDDQSPWVQLLAAGLKGDIQTAQAKWAEIAPEPESAIALYTHRCAEMALSGPSGALPWELRLAKRIGGEKGVHRLIAAARLARRSGAHDLVEEILQTAARRAKTPRNLAELGEVAALGGFFEMGRQLAEVALAQDPTNARALRVCAQDALARADWDTATTLADRMEQAGAAPMAASIRGSALAAQGQHEQARPHLETALETRPKDVNARLWSARLAEPHDPNVAADHMRAVEGNHTERATMLLLPLFSDDRPKDVAALLKTPEIRDNMYGGFFDIGLPEWTSPQAVEGALRSDEALFAFVEEILGRFRGNLAEPLSFFDGTARRPLAPHASVRSQAADAIMSVQHAPPEVVMERLTALAAEHPESPHPDCYRGELLLWLGRYDDALAAFEAARERFPARWSYVGAAAVHAMRGEAAAAQAQLDTCGREYRPLASATTPVYQGEMARRAGDFAAARSMLTRALDAKPTRHGARANLALVAHAEGATSELIEHYRHLWVHLPGLMHHASASLGLRAGDRWSIGAAPQVLERALTMMRGNRSSRVVTYFVDDRLHVAPQLEEWTALASAILAYLREQL